ncbi:hypothetical protein [Paenibacillus glacialis]|uniref:hypothetical protein n=1 Tax=Paenibacillus glacialis TaxID=494026 RepID=UPI000A017380|nr:hypothetical protein [Paenibacillus glacialis]
MSDTLLVPNVMAHRVQIWIGIPQARQHIQLKDVPFTLRRTIAPYLDQEANGWKSANIEDYTRYTFEWDYMLQLGDEVKRNHETYIITKREGQMIRGLMTWSYECALSAGLKVPKIYNQTIIGAAIEGRILEVSRNQVRLHLDMDDQQKPKDAQWFPYSAEGNQVWYLMPEKGAQVKLYFPSADEDDAMVVQSVRTKPSGAAVSSSHATQGVVIESPAERHQRKTADPGVKSFANPQGKEISLGTSELSMSAKEGSLYISMNTHHGVSLNSTQLKPQAALVSLPEVSCFRQLTVCTSIQQPIRWIWIRKSTALALKYNLKLRSINTIPNPFYPILRSKSLNRE